MARSSAPAQLPAPLAAWFAARGWQLHPHQRAMLQAARKGRSALLIAPTGGGKTLAGFLPSLTELTLQPARGLHTIYISPLKALAVDVHRNVDTPIAEADLPIRAETRTGDTPQSKRQRQRSKPPHILMTTPESLALMLSYPDADRQFRHLRCVIIDEVHSLTGTKRGDLLSLGLARLAHLAPEARRVGLSATVAEPERLAAWLGSGMTETVKIIRGDPGIAPQIDILLPGARVPWAGHMAMHAIPDIYAAIRRARTAIVFVNTRAQAELALRELWRINDDNLAIALHHGSLAADQRRKVEAAMAAGRLRAVIATASLDLGIDWGAVDLVVQMGAPKGISRLLQRVGRANHRLDCPSRAILVPGNRFELLECRAAIAAAAAGALDGTPDRPGALDVLAQHVLGCACSAPLDPGKLYAEVITAQPYAKLDRASFDAVFDYVATGGYTLRAYERYQRLRPRQDGLWQITTPAVLRLYRMNVGTIVEAPMLSVRMKRGARLGQVRLGQVEEWFVQGLQPGDTFIFAGRLLRFEGIRDMQVICTAAAGTEPKIPAYNGGKLPLSSILADRVRALLQNRRNWNGLPPDVRTWLQAQHRRSALPRRDNLLVETFPRGKRHFLVAYGFSGRNAHQTLGMLLTRRMERFGHQPLGFVATDYALAIWSLKPAEKIPALFHPDMMGDDLEAWMAESALLKRTFRNVAVIAGLIERRHPGQEKTGRQVTFSSDTIYDVLRRYQPDHILLQATWADAAGGLVDARRLSDLLAAVEGRIDHRALDRVSPLAVPLLLEIGGERVPSSAEDALLAQAAAEALIDEAMQIPPCSARSVA
jgi:ATP-dependent Lhr-like helicase